MIKQYKKLILSIGLLTALASGMAGAAASSRDSREASAAVAGEFDHLPWKVRVLVRGLQQRSLEEGLAKIAHSVAEFLPGLKHMGSYFPEGSIERAVFENLKLSKQFSLECPQYITTLTLRETPALNEIDCSSIYGLDCCCIYETEDYGFKVINRDGKYFLVAWTKYDTYLVLMHKGQFVVNDEEKLHEMVKGMKIGDSLDLFDVQWLEKTRRPFPELVLQLVREKLQVTKEQITDERLNSCLRPIYKKNDEIIKIVKGMELVQDYNKDISLRIFPMCSRDDDMSSYLGVSPEGLDRLDVTLPEDHPLRELIEARK